MEIFVNNTCARYYSTIPRRCHGVKYSFWNHLGDKYDNMQNNKCFIFSDWTESIRYYSLRNLYRNIVQKLKNLKFNQHFSLTFYERKLKFQIALNSTKNQYPFGMFTISKKQPYRYLEKISSSYDQYFLNDNKKINQNW